VNYIGRKNSTEISSLARELKLTPLETAIEEGIGRPEIGRGVEILLDDLRKVQTYRDEAPTVVAETAWEIIGRRGFIADLREIKGIARIIERFATLGELSWQIEKLDALSRAPKEQKIHLSTIHRAKGLEHKAVILLGCVEGMLPLNVGEETNISEERRLAYVALTRAKDLFIALAPETLYGESAIPSRFIREMGLKEAEWVKEAA